MDLDDRFRFIQGAEYASLKDIAAESAMAAVERVSIKAPDQQIAMHLAIDAMLNAMANMIWNLREFGLDAEAMMVATQAANEFTKLAEKIKKEAA